MKRWEVPQGREGEAADLHLFYRKVAIVAGFVIGFFLLLSLRRILVLLFIAAVLAAGISPAVRRVRTVVRLYTGRRMQRGTAVLLVYFPFLLAAILVSVFAVPHFLIETRELGVQLPAVLDQKILRPLERYVPLGSFRELIASGDFAEDLPLFGYLRGAIGVIASAAAVLFLVVYILVDAERLRNLYLLLYPAPQRAKKHRMIRRISKRMSSWLSGQLLLVTIIGTATFIGLVILGVPYALPLALIAAVGEVIPIIGPIVGAIPALIIALFQSSRQFWLVLVLAIVIQQVENYFLVPRVMGKRVAISPLSVFVAFMIGASLFGLVGALMAIPAAAIIQVIFEEAFVARRERRQDSERPGTLSKAEE
ncbi:MAG TPA: AI-2E family transporter [Thermoanaerobaculia bacterium]